MRRVLPVLLPVFLLTGFVVVVTIWDGLAHSSAHMNTQGANGVSSSYLYYTLKEASGFVLARAAKGADGQPTGTPHPVASFTDGFGLEGSDAVLSMQLSPDGQFLAIDGTRDHGEQVWMFDTQNMTMSLTPPNVMGNFLHWLPNLGHTFLYRPMMPMGPSAPMDSNGWNPGLWEVDAYTGAHRNIDISVPSAYLIDASPSPDGSRIIYSTTTGLGLGSSTYIMNSDGSGRTMLLHMPGGAQSITALFTWSPNGASVAYEQLSDSPVPFLPAGLWVMHLGSGALSPSIATTLHPQRLADTDGGHGYAPVWAPDSSSIAFVLRTNPSNPHANEQVQALQTAIAVVNVATHRSEIVASPKQTGVQLNLNPSWSSDSANITFIASNPLNLAIGGTPRYWLAQNVEAAFEHAQLGPQPQLSLTPLTAPMAHIAAVG
ncbi:MAG TPA: hypothetical protein VNG51_04325 [Ktedonobacteraceae bacterium]|nr:hypothetical protein [Ktedonobacteraceae bacterium]